MGQCLQRWVSVCDVGQCLQLWVIVCNGESMFMIVGLCLQWWVSVCNCGSVAVMVGQCLWWLVSVCDGWSVFVMVGQCLWRLIGFCDGGSVFCAGESVWYGRSMSATAAAHHHWSAVPDPTLDFVTHDLQFCILPALTLWQASRRLKGFSGRAWCLDTAGFVLNCDRTQPYWQSHRLTHLAPDQPPPFRYEIPCQGK